MTNETGFNFKKISTIAFFALLLGVGAVFLRMILPYVFAIFWAAVIASLFMPVYHFFLKKFRRENVSAALSVVTVILVVVIPLAGILGIVVQQAIGTYNKLSDPETVTKIQNEAERILALPMVQDALGQVDIESRLRSAASTITSTGFAWIRVGTKSTLTTVVNVLIMLYALYYFFKDGERWLQKAMRLLPFGDNNEKVLYEKFASTSKATLKGTILIGGIQGAIGGIFFFIVGLPSAAFWGLIMVVLSIIPAVGAFIVWFPAAIYLLLTGQTWQGIVLIIGGVLIGLVDNVLRAPLVGKDIQMHPILILFSTIGGIGLFGISGVVIGPIVAAFFLAVLQMYETRYKKELQSAHH